MPMVTDERATNEALRLWRHSLGVKEENCSHIEAAAPAWGRPVCPAVDTQNGLWQFDLHTALEMLLTRRE